MEFITRLLYPVWTFARSTIESILGKRGRDEIVDNNDDIVDLSPTISDIFDVVSNDGEVDMNYYTNFLNYDMDADMNASINQNFLISPQRNIETLPSNKSVKVNIINVIKNNTSINKLNEIVEKMHLLRMLTTLILKLFILYKKFESNKPLNIKRIINVNFIVILMESIAADKTQTVGRRSGRESKRPKYLDVYNNNYNDDCSSSSDEMDSEVLRKQLLAFINDIVLEEGIDEENGLSQDIKEMILNGIDIKGLQNTIRWIANEIVTSYQQNIIQNYKTYIERFVNVFYLRGKSSELEAIENSGASKDEKKDEKRVLLLKYRNVKDDLVEPDPAKYKSKSPSALLFIKIHKRMLFPKIR